MVADYDEARSRKAVDALGDDRFVAAQVDASDAASVEALVREHGITHVMNAVDPRFVMPIFDGAFAGGADYLDMAMSLSYPHPEDAVREVGVKLGDEQFAVADMWKREDRLALVGIGVEPGLSDVFARYAADHLFSEIDELGTRDGANLEVAGYEFAPSFSIWTTIEECLNPPVIWEKDRGWFTTPPFSEPEVFDFPEGIGPVECVNVEHEEVLLMPRWVDCKRATFKYGLGNEFIEVLKTLHKIGLDRTDKVKVGGVEVSPRDVVAACLPDPATLGDKMTGKTCAGLYVTGTGKDGQPTGDVPLPRGRQRVVDEGVRPPVRGLADRDQPGRRARAARHRRLAGHRCARPRGVRRGAVPRPADGVRQSVGPARPVRLRLRPARGRAGGPLPSPMVTARPRLPVRRTAIPASTPTEASSSMAAAMSRPCDRTGDLDGDQGREHRRREVGQAVAQSPAGARSAGTSTMNKARSSQLPSAEPTIATRTAITTRRPGRVTPREDGGRDTRGRTDQDRRRRG